MTKTDFEKKNLFGKGQANDAYAQYFSGPSFLNPLTKAGEGKPFFANVTFAPACRNNWHIHHAKKGGGQVLLCIAGEGWYQEWGKPAKSLHPGDVVEIPPAVKHWHGAKETNWFSHVAIEIPGEESRNEWLEPVDEKDYATLSDNEGSR